MDHERGSTLNAESMPGHLATEALTADTRAPDDARCAPCLCEGARRAPSQGSGTSLLPLRRLLTAGHLLPGDWVEVRSEAEILATLDGEGTLDSLPFMSEMRRFVGGRFQVKTRADRTFVEIRGARSMVDTVHLDGVYCDGGAHDDCCRRCLLFWKEAWLRRVGDPRGVPPPPAPRPRPVQWKTRRSDGKGYFGQATQLPLATIRTLRLHDLRAHVGALWNEEVGPLALAQSLAIRAHDIVQQRLLGGKEWSVVPGVCTQRTPSVSVGLTPGERVRVKSEREILATLDRNGKNRGLEFSREMLRFCGQELTVLRRCDRIICDDPPKMMTMKDTVLLEGLVYLGLSFLAIPRGEHFFWRECWLERVGGRGSGPAASCRLGPEPPQTPASCGGFLRARLRGRSGRMALDDEARARGLRRTSPA